MIKIEATLNKGSVGELVDFTQLGHEHSYCGSFFWMENNNCIIVCSLNNIECILAHLKNSSILLYLSIELRNES